MRKIIGMKQPEGFYDDPFEETTPEQREKAKAWFNKVVANLIKPKRCSVFHTRIHEDDIAKYLRK